jgi:hypothetical protein
MAESLSGFVLLVALTRVMPYSDRNTVAEPMVGSDIRRKRIGTGPQKEQSVQSQSGFE